MRLSRLAAALIVQTITPREIVNEMMAAISTTAAITPQFASAPRHTPKMSDRPQRGWRTIQRKARWSKLNARIRANRRSI